MARMITRIEEGKTLLWTGNEDFDPISVQKKLKASGLTLEEIRADKWAIIGSSYKTENTKENDNA